MRDIAIVSTARTPIGKAYKGYFNNTEAPTLAAHAMRAAIERAGIEHTDIDDVVLGCAVTQGTSGVNVARHAVMAAGLPVSLAAATIDRQCASGLSAIAAGAAQIATGDSRIVLCGGVESISLAQNEHMNRFRDRDPRVEAAYPRYYTSMIETAEFVADLYGISRERQDEFAVLSHQRALKAQLQDEIVPVEVSHAVKSALDGSVAYRTVTVRSDEGPRESDIDVLGSLRPVLPDGRHVTAGNASQLSDGAAALVLMDASIAAQKGLKPLGLFRGVAVSGCPPEKMGIGPILAIPKLLRRFGLTIDDIDLWEINEAFASQLLACTDALGIPHERLNVNGGAIAIGHPYGMTGTRLAGHVLLEARRRSARFAVVSMCVGGGQGVAGLIEIV
ncbi:hypothetical protein N185_16180 [Sinorhizobium sp. GW3]|nr:hypothetical protein N185_16180 [Sinorhizobium sp. GW3]